MMTPLKFADTVEKMTDDQRYWLRVMDDSMKSLYRGFTIFTVLNLLFSEKKIDNNDKNLYTSDFTDRICLDGNIGRIDATGKLPGSLSTMHKNGWTVDEVMKFMLTHPETVFTNMRETTDDKGVRA